MKPKKPYPEHPCWDYRVVETEQGHGIYEVFYDGNGEVEGYTSFSLEGYTPQELAVEVQEIQKAFSKPILKEEELKYNIWMNLQNLSLSKDE